MRRVSCFPRVSEGAGLTAVVVAAAHLSVGTLDQLILSICSRDGVVPMDMLMGAWRRANRVQRETPAGRLDEKKLEVLNEAKGMCVNYAVTCITMPDMFEYVFSLRPGGGVGC